MTTFKVSKDIEISTINKYKNQTIKNRLLNSKVLKDVKLESYDKETQVLELDDFPLILGLNGFAEAIHTAYDQHHGLTLSPDHLWVTILQGLSIHISLNPKTSREKMGLAPKPEGDETKDKIEIRRNDFKLGDINNPWNELFPVFLEEISKKVNKEVHEVLVKPFSTSDDLSLAVTCLTIMDAYKSYFEYILITGCGIPEITLLGSSNDWECLYERTETLLSRFEELNYWKEQLLPVLQQFIKAKKDVNNVDLEFWESFYKLKGGSGGPFINGWIKTFFPYIQTYQGYEKNTHIDWKEDSGMFSGLTFNLIPLGFTNTPFIWNYYGEKFEMAFIGGFLGVKKAENENSIMPALSWAVIHL